ncbi:extracelular serine carboxypeptidase [Aspergillus sclerotioniger CBS 115572]|uniref:Extracelular serine carboxypeptidase n=1 Tax=Aspergillus sclerotioniger CBS 115572 TaxID=1450535 RepID=A0A317X363_9EURO|nr:extracelular serine carboxypeptidase [Aspergillus sclerotioniger CBS 115572]PWY93069.1 extracelular serine carboxypeptidase [Aspergillus sclerotioniger CBS 115572]
MFLSLSLLGTLIASSVALDSSPLEQRLPHLHHLSQLSQPSFEAQSATFPVYNLSVPIDHFHNESRYEPHTNATFGLRYWLDTTHYRPGGPVFVIAAGETDGNDRIPFLSQGVVTQLAAAYHGVGLILEHRYYGESYPFANLTTENIRFLTTEQAMADYAYFASNVVFPGLEDLDLTAATTPWIAYGGSYAGAFVAFLRKLYPEVYWGAVSSSGVTEAIIDYWEYYEPIRLYGPAQCISALQTSVDIVDQILISHADNTSLAVQLKSAFGGTAPSLKNQNFVSYLSYGLDSFQSRNWDKAVGTPLFRAFCNNITDSQLLYPTTTDPISTSVKQLIEIAGYSPSNTTLVTNFLNWIGFLNTSGVFANTSSESSSSTADFTTPQPLTKSSDTSWSYQVCVEWGYFTTGSSVPATIKPLISRLLDIPYLSSFCASQFGISTPPDVQRINQYGGFNFSYPRVAIIGGLADPWRDATPLADGVDWESRNSTDSEPVIMLDIPAADVWDDVRGAVHHWDQNGLSGQEIKNGEEVPKEIISVHEEVVRFVGVWLDERESSALDEERLYQTVL